MTGQPSGDADLTRALYAVAVGNVIAAVPISLLGGYWWAAGLLVVAGGLALAARARG